MKSPSRDHSQPQTVYKIGFASYVYLRFLLSTFILLGLVLHPTSGVSAYEGKATLVIKGSLVCIMHGRIDRQNTEAKIPLQLPKEDGPIEGKGWWRTNSTGYGTGYLTGGGLVVLKGQLRNGFLIFPWPDYYLYGKLQGKPAVPPIRLKAVAGSEFVQQTPYKECKGALVYRLEMPSERWRITVDGWDRLARGDQPHAIPRPRSLGRPSPWTSEPGKSAQVKYDNVSFGLLVHWRMIVDVEIEKGRYKRGTGRASMVSDTPYCNPSGVYTCKSRRTKARNSPFTVLNGVKSGQQLTLTLFSRKYRYTDVDLLVGYECQLDKLAAEMTIVKWKAKNLPNRVVDKDVVILPDQISAFLIDNWTDGKKGQPHDRFYKVKKLK